MLTFGSLGKFNVSIFIVEYMRSYLNTWIGTSCRHVELNFSSGDPFELELKKS